VRVLLFFKGYAKNEVKGKVYVRSNDPTRPVAEVEILAKVNPEYLVEPAELDFGAVRAGLSHAAKLTIRQNGDEPLIVQGIEAPEQLACNIR